MLCCCMHCKGMMRPDAAGWTCMICGRMILPDLPVVMSFAVDRPQFGPREVARLMYDSIARLNADKTSWIMIAKLVNQAGYPVSMNSLFKAWKAEELLRRRNEAQAAA